jgi:hypothetical protein
VRQKSEENVMQRIYKGCLVLLAISAVAVAGRNFAQENKGISDGLSAVPDSGQNAKADKESASARSADNYMNSMDSHAEKTAHAAEGKTPKSQVATFDSPPTPAPRSLADILWIATLAGFGILVSMSALGYVWWSRGQHALAGRGVVLALKPDQSHNPETADRQDNTPQRRAA